MPYTVNFTDRENKSPVTVFDNTENRDTSIIFPGRNVTGYGQIIADNFLHLLENFASGIETHGDARSPMAIKYFLVAILFVLFDVEVIFFYPYAVNFKSLGWSGFMEVILFVFFFLVGFIYIIKKGALKWED